ncbi:Glycerol kinase [Orobanche hederae]
MLLQRSWKIMSSGDTKFVYKWIFKICENSSSSKYREEKSIKRGILTLLQRATLVQSFG